MTSWTCGGFLCDAPEVIFALFGDGFVAFRGSVDGPVMQTQLDQAEIEQLLEFAIDDGGLRDTENESAFSAIDGVEFDVRAVALTRDFMILSPIERLLQSTQPSHQAIRGLAQRLLDFGAEMGDRARRPSTSAMTPAEQPLAPTETAPGGAIWQPASAGIWVSPQEYYGVSPEDLLALGLPSTSRELQLVWRLPNRVGDTLAVHFERISEGLGGSLRLDLNVPPDATSPDGSVRTSLLPELPPGCYEVSLEIGGATGRLVECIRL